MSLLIHEQSPRGWAAERTEDPRVKDMSAADELDAVWDECDEAEIVADWDEDQVPCHAVVFKWVLQGRNAQFDDESDEWFSESLNLDRHGRTEEALDIVYSKINEWLRMRQTQQCDAFIRRLNVEALPNRMLLAIAILTRSASHEIPYREEFFGRAWKALESRGKDAEKLLGRLRDAPYRVPAKRPSGIRRILGWH
ncbi:MAG TPA: hypothetical protein VH518_16235 [Tepidisphaeraceae bacterium]|jgi:hypothetical protein